MTATATATATVQLAGDNWETYRTTRPGMSLCTMCDAPATWTGRWHGCGLYPNGFITGRTCRDHRDNLIAVTREEAASEAEGHRNGWCVCLHT